MQRQRLKAIANAWWVQRIVYWNFSPLHSLRLCYSGLMCWSRGFCPSGGARGPTGSVPSISVTDVCRKYGFPKVSGRLAKLRDHGQPPYYQTGMVASCHIGPDRPCVGLILYSSSFAVTLTFGRHILPCMHPVTYK